MQPCVKLISPFWGFEKTFQIEFELLLLYVKEAKNSKSNFKWFFQPKRKTPTCDNVSQIMGSNLELKIIKS